MSESEETRLNGSTATADRNLSLLERGVARGIITAQQHEALLALNRGEPAAIETGRGFNAVSVAYWSGGIAVLAACAWFLINRWDALGPGGVLMVTLVYAVFLVVMARVLWTNGFRHASALSTVLAVGLTPIVTWSLLMLTGWWDQFPELGSGASVVAELDWPNVRWLPIDLATILAALVASRRVRFSMLALPIAVALSAASVHGLSLILVPDLANQLAPRLTMLVAVMLLSIGYAIDRRSADGEDYALWFYVAGLVWTAASILTFFGRSAGIAAHSMLFVSVLFAVAALQLRRKLFLVASTLGFLGYLAYLTFDVFKQTLGYPVLLATSGLVIILAAVWFQRRFPDLQERMSAPGPRVIPGAPLALAGAVVIALTMIFTDVPDARARIRERYQREAVQRALAHNHHDGRPLRKIPAPPRNQVRP